MGHRPVQKILPQVGPAPSAGDRLQQSTHRLRPPTQYPSVGDMVMCESELRFVTSIKVLHLSTRCTSRGSISQDLLLSCQKSDSLMADCRIIITFKQLSLVFCPSASQQQQQNICPKKEERNNREAFGCIAEDRKSKCVPCCGVWKLESGLAPPVHIFPCVSCTHQPVATTSLSYAQCGAKRDIKTSLYLRTRPPLG